MDQESSVPSIAKRQTIWLTSATTGRTWMEFSDENGSFNIGAVAASIEVHPETLIVGKLRPYPGITIGQIKALVDDAEQRGDDEDSALIVDGSLLHMSTQKLSTENNPVLQSLQTSLEILQKSFVVLAEALTSARANDLHLKELVLRVEKAEKMLATPSNAGKVQQNNSF